MEAGAPFQRLDVWLWHARLARSKAECGALIKAGGFRVNRQPATKAHARLRLGDTVTFARRDEVRVWRVLALAPRRGPPAEARALYEDLATVEH